VKGPHPLFLSVLLIYGAFFPWPSAAKSMEGKVLMVFDGDTILVRIEGRDEHVRLREIDAPEVTTRKQIGQEPWGGRARQRALAFLRGKTVRLEIEEGDARDRYQRILAYVFEDGTFINKEMIRSGNAFFYPPLVKGKYAKDLEAAEREARDKGVGIWNPKNGLKERPSEFRLRTHRDNNLFSNFAQQVGNAPGKKHFKEYPVPEGKIVANKRSMVYHMPGSMNAKRVDPKNRVYFDSKAEAEKAGFRPARKE